MLFSLPLSQRFDELPLFYTAQLHSLEKTPFAAGFLLKVAPLTLWHWAAPVRQPRDKMPSSRNTSHLCRRLHRLLTWLRCTWGADTLSKSCLTSFLSNWYIYHTLIGLHWGTCGSLSVAAIYVFIHMTLFCLLVWNLFCDSIGSSIT